MSIMAFEQKIGVAGQLICSFFKENGLIFLAIFLTGYFAYGYEITNLTFSIDEEIFWQN